MRWHSTGWEHGKLPDHPAEALLVRLTKEKENGKEVRKARAVDVDEK